MARQNEAKKTTNVFMVCFPQTYEIKIRNLKFICNNNCKITTKTVYLLRNANIIYTNNNMGKLINEFKQFAVKGNAVDMAVGVIIGGAFGKIVSSIVNDLIMPPIGWLIGGVNFTDLKVTLPAIDMGIEKLEPATINYGNFIQTTFDFLIISLCVFIMLRAVNKMIKKNEDTKKETEQAKPAEPTKEEQLLTEIRDLLKRQS